MFDLSTFNWHGAYGWALVISIIIVGVEAIASIFEEDAEHTKKMCALLIFLVFLAGGSFGGVV